MATRMSRMGALSGEAADSWNRFDEDVRLMQRAGVQLIPLQRGVGPPGAHARYPWDAEAMARYQGAGPARCVKRASPRW